VTFQSIRFGAVEVPEEDVIDFPLGLVGLGGRRYAIIDRNPGTGFFWLHSVEDPALGLPIVRPQQFFPDFSLRLSQEDRERTGVQDPASALVYVTVRATPNPADITANLRAPLLIVGGHGYQVLNANEQAPFRAPLFDLSAQTPPQPQRSANAA
jgi:flagellar assembly factor FliW